MGTTVTGETRETASCRAARLQLTSQGKTKGEHHDSSSE
jgi:hypothetical protein